MTADSTLPLLAEITELRDQLAELSVRYRRCRADLDDAYDQISALEAKLRRAPAAGV